MNDKSFITLVQAGTYMFVKPSIKWSPKVYFEYPIGYSIIIHIHRDRSQML